MLKGDISNKPSPIVMVDWEVLIEPKVSLSNLSAEVFHNYILFGAQKEKDFFPLRRNAKWWLERNFDHRFLAFTIDVHDNFRRAIEPSLFDIVAEIEHFEDRKEYREYLRINNQILVSITNNDLLLDATTKKFLGWGGISEYF